MEYVCHYPSPLGDILLACDDLGLTGLWFAGQAHYARGLGAHIQEEHPILSDAKRWLDCYFSGEVPAFTPPLHPRGTPFQREIWRKLLEIPYGSTCAYGSLGAARAVGCAVGRNPISIIIPCHRVVAASGRLTGYAGGLERKLALLRLEGADKGE